MRRAPGSSHNRPVTAAPAATDPMPTAELARRIGVTVQTFWKNRQRYQLIDRMPPALTSAHRAWDRATIEAWLQRHHPARPAARPANDAAPLPPPGNDAEWQGYLASHYGVPAE